MGSENRAIAKNGHLTSPPSVSTTIVRATWNKIPYHLFFKWRHSIWQFKGPKRNTTIETALHYYLVMLLFSSYFTVAEYAHILQWTIKHTEYIWRLIARNWKTPAVRDVWRMVLVYNQIHQRTSIIRRRQPKVFRVNVVKKHQIWKLYSSVRLMIERQCETAMKHWSWDRRKDVQIISLSGAFKRYKRKIWVWI